MAMAYLTRWSGPIKEAEDLNGNDLPDDWEAAFNFNLPASAIANADSDGDGLTNFQEYLAGTHPQNSSDSPQLTVNQHADGGEALRFMTVPGKIYRVERNNDFPVGQWIALPGAKNLVGTGALLQISDPAARSLSKRLYRMRVLP